MIKQLPSVTPDEAEINAPDSIDLHDKVYDAYYGKLGDKFMQETQRRIHWICSQASGTHILDIGCSQGITSILLGREGKQVTGIDVDSTSIAEAQKHLALEPRQIRENVCFLNTDASSHQFTTKKFDTVILTEVLEHLVQPERLIKVAVENLSPGGQLIVTVPFGINRYIDHKQTYYLREPYQLISKDFRVTDVLVLGKWLGIVARYEGKKSDAIKTFTDPLVKKLESGFFDLENKLRNELSVVKANLDHANKKYHTSTQLLSTERKEISEEKSLHKAAETLNSQLESRLEKAEKLLQGEQLNTIEAQKSLLHAEKSSVRFETELTNTKKLLNEANTKYRGSTEQIRTINNKLSSIQTSHESQTKEIDTLRLQLTNAEKSLTKESDTHKLSVKSLETELQKSRGQEQRSKTKYKKLIKKVTTLKNKLVKVKTKYNSSLTSIKSLDKSVSISLSKYDDSKKMFTLLKHKLEKSEKHIIEEKKKNKSIANKIKDANRDFAIATQDITLRNEQVSTLISSYQKETEKTAELEGFLTEKNNQYKQTETIISDLQEKLDQSSIHVERADELQRLIDQKKQETVTVKEQARLLESQSDTLKAQLREQKYKAEKSKIDGVRNRVEITQSQDQIEKLRKQVQIANQKVTKTRATLSFQLGHALIFSPKSINNFKSLPRQLWTLRKEAKKRRTTKQTPSFNQLSLPNPVTEFDPAIAISSEVKRVTPKLKLVSSQPPLLAEMLKALKVATIMDEFTFGSYRDECNLLQLTPQHWQKELESFQPEMLFIESAWRGKDELWGSKVGHMSQEVVSIVNWCQENAVPTVFWNKEDPVHFETFLSTAKMFDYVFTTDIDCIHRYKAALGHEQVFLLPFAAQPTLSNPIEKYQRKDAFCFAGAYYARYPERTKDLGNFIASLPEFKPVEIYDRNYGKDDPAHQFPTEYQPFIVGNLPFDKIDKAYKGYNYAINLNSIKQSQSMFARRVFELLASNTISVSNFSRGIRLLFGELLVTTDDGMEAVRRLKKLAGNGHSTRKLRLAALRKVMREHTYQDRLAYVVSKVKNQTIANLLPHIVVTAYAKNQQQAELIFNSFEQQSHNNKSLALVVPGGFKPANQPKDKTIRVIPAPEAQTHKLNELGGAEDWLSVMVPDDYYGSNYLLDLAIATRYAQASVVGKASVYVYSTHKKMNISNDGKQYRQVARIPARSGMIKINLTDDSNLRDWVSTLYTKQFEQQNALSIDEFNYCKNAGGDHFDASQRTIVDDLSGLNTGMELSEIISQAEKITPEAPATTTTPQLNGDDLVKLFSNPPPHTQVSTILEDKLLQIDSALEDGKHEYWYAATDHSPQELGVKNGRLPFHLKVTPGLNLQLTLLFLDPHKQRISHVVKTANRNHEAEVPANTAYIRLGLRVYAAGSARIHSLLLGHRKLQPAKILATGEHLLLTNHYPSNDDLYRNGFVHSRVVAYKKQGLKVDVFRLRSGEALSYHEFGDVDCITGSQEALHLLLSSGQHKSIMVHFLDEAMWDVLKHHVDRIRITVWVHGAEIQPFHRREYNYTTQEERKAAKVQSAKRMKFWHGLLQPMPAKLKLIFVSKYFAEEVMEDLGFRLPETQYSVIHNPINTDLFSYEAKSVTQRKKILSIRPFASAKYANDLSVKAIQKLSRKPWFNELEFRIIGDGSLFEETLSPLRKFKNIHIEQRFLSQNEIALLHKSYGVFLCPTRMDAQGVSRDEAMSSGLVPVTNAVTAIPEFVDENCGILAPAEDAEAMAEGIERLFLDEELFARMSEQATLRVQHQTSNKLIIEKEILEIKDMEVGNDSSSIQAMAQR